MEDYAYVLEFFPQGFPLDKHPEHKNRPMAQVLGEKYFMLLEVAPRRGIHLVVGEKVYIGPGFRPKVQYIYGRIEYEDLSLGAKDEIPRIVDKIVRENERVFVEFFNIAEPITLKLHSLELLPGVGKKITKILLEERVKKRFSSFQDLSSRVKISDPAKIIRDRIIAELMGGEKYYLFVKPPPGKPGKYLGYLPRLYRRVKSV